MPLPTENGGRDPEQRNQLWRLSSMGFTLATEVAAGVLIGWMIDWALGTNRTFLVIGAVVGVLVGLSGFIRAAMRENQRLEKERRRR